VVLLIRQRNAAGAELDEALVDRCGLDADAAGEVGLLPRPRIEKGLQDRDDRLGVAPLSHDPSVSQPAMNGERRARRVHRFTPGICLQVHPSGVHCVSDPVGRPAQTGGEGPDDRPGACGAQGSGLGGGRGRARHRGRPEVKGALKGQRSIRLSKGYRAYYRVVKEAVEFLRVEGVNKHVY